MCTPTFWSLKRKGNVVEILHPEGIHPSIDGWDLVKIYPSEGRVEVENLSFHPWKDRDYPHKELFVSEEEISSILEKIEEIEARERKEEEEKERKKKKNGWQKSCRLSMRP